MIEALINFGVVVLVTAVVLFIIRLVFGEALKPNWWRALLAIAGLVLLFVGLDMFGLYHCQGLDRHR